MVDQQTNILLAVFERRDLNFDIIDTVEKFLVKNVLRAASTRFLLVAANIRAPDGRIIVACRWMQTILLECPADLSLHVRIYFGNFIKKNRAAGRGFKQTDGVIMRLVLGNSLPKTFTVYDTKGLSLRWLLR